MSESVLQNKFGGVNQRVLRTEALDFSSFDGTFPLNVGIQNRVYGKAVLQQFSSPIQAIFQFFTPQGYGQSIFQTNTSIDLSPWLLGSYNFPLAPDDSIISPSSLPIDGSGSLGDGGYSSESGALGGTGLAYRYKITITDVAIAPFISNLKYFTGTYSNLNVIPLPNGQPFPPLPYLGLVLVAATTQTTPPTSALVATQNDSSTNHIDNNLFPPPNNIQTQSWSSTSTDTTGNIDVSSLLNSNVILITILATINGVANIEIPLSTTQTFEQIQTNPILTVKTSDYIIPATITQSSQYGPMFFSNQGQSSSITFNFLQVYTCQLTRS